MKTIIQFFEESVNKFSDNVFMWEKKGEEYLAAKSEEFDKRWQSLIPDDYANICYTSGTTADPKGIILSHKI